MSRAALALAVRAQLQSPYDDPTSPGLGPGLDPTNLSGWRLERKDCDVTLLGQPTAIAGDLFVGIYCGPRSNTPPNAGLDEEYTVHVVISRRVTSAPWDRVASDIIHPAGGLDDFADAVRRILGKDYIDGHVRTRADTILIQRSGQNPLENHVSGFSQGLKFLRESDYEPADGGWWHSDEGDEPAGIVLRQTYGGIRRTQSWIDDENMVVT